MSNIKHTPGKWIVDESIKYTISVISPWSKENDVSNSAVFGDYRGGIICSANWNTGVPSYEQALANAQLISSAPELLEALKMCVNYVGAGANDSEPLKNAWEKAKNAIAKAEGK
jgi:hypothetical protein